MNDQNSLDRARHSLYRSSYGPTFDGLQKPEVIAPGIWVPAPILPHTPTAAEAELYARLDRASDEELLPLIEEHKEVDRDIYEARALPTYLIRQLVSVKLHEADVISEHYKFVDGTSFAAPIVSSTVACMLEANPHLSPQQVKRILIDTAERLPGVEIDRQGWGVIAPRRAVEVALSLQTLSVARQLQPFSCVLRLRSERRTAGLSSAGAWRAPCSGVVALPSLRDGVFELCRENSSRWRRSRVRRCCPPSNVVWRRAWCRAYPCGWGRNT